MKKKIKSTLGYAVVFLMVFSGALLAFAARWAVNSFGDISVDEIIFHLRVPLEGTEGDVLKEFAVQALLPTIVITIFFLLLRVFSKKREKVLTYWRKHNRKELWLETGNKRKGKKTEHLLIPTVLSAKSVAVLSVLFIVAGILYGSSRVPILDYIKKELHESSLIEDNYVDPGEAVITFPEKKRNLVYIFLESMETTFMDEEHGGVMEVSLIPELTKLAEENLSFSSRSEGQLGGAQMVPGTTWTIAGMFSQTCGLPLRLHVNSNDMSKYDSFFPGVTSLGEILEQEGYVNWLVCGSDVKFGGRENYFSQHGNYQFLDWVRAQELGLIPQGYKETWGFEDQKLFQFARDKVTELAASDKPFNLTVLTVDTHKPKGYQCPLCQNQFETQYENVLACSSRQVYDFVTWLQEQDFYDNTTVILCGDHTTMAKWFIDSKIPQDYMRSTYQVILNAAATPVQTENRQFTNMDMFPTTLAALGCEIEGERLGIGTNLFSSQPTLLEEVGYDRMNEELEYGSKYYDERFMYGEIDR